MKFGGHVPMISAIVRVNKPLTLAIGALEMITVEEREAIRRAYYLYVDKSFAHRCIPRQFVEAAGS